jgi:hypothetical protein
MNKIISYSFFLVFLVFTACEKNEPSAQEILVGEWQVMEISAKLEETNQKPIDINQNFSKNKYVFTFNADGTFRIQMDNATKDLFESLNADLLSINPEEEAGTYIIQGEYIVYSIQSPGKSPMVWKQKLIFNDNDNISIELNRNLYLENALPQIREQAPLFALLGVKIEDVIKEIENSLKDFNSKTILTRVKKQ